MPSSVRFAVVRQMLRTHGWVLDRISGSHHIFTKPGRVPFSVPVHRGQVKYVYVRKVEKLIAEDEGSD